MEKQLAKAKQKVNSLAIKANMASMASIANKVNVANIANTANNYWLYGIRLKTQLIETDTTAYAL